ncbi:MAG: hypothetical protein JW888_00620 [Pirellulales bacterium]|nr:hypothetical protein [Pirellulales bacterium]
MRSLKKPLKWTFIILGSLVVVILVVNACFVWTTGSRLERKLAEIRAAGDPTSLADFRPKPVAPEQNAVTYLRRAQEDLKAIEHELTPVVKANDDPRSRKRLAAIRSAMEAYPEVIPLLEKAANCPEYSVAEPFGPAGTGDPNAALETVMSRSREYRSAARLLGSYRCSVLLSEGQYDEAAKSAIALMKLTRHFDNEPSLVAFLVAVACRGYAFEPLNEALQSRAVSEEVHQALEEELARHDLRRAFQQNLKTERAFGLEQFLTFPGARTWFARAFYNRYKLNYLGLIEWYLTDTEKAASSGPGGPATPPEPTDIFSSLLVPALEATRKAATRTESMVRAVRVLNALERRGDPDALPAADLSDLGLPKEATLDAFNGKPLIVKKVPGGWLIYSVGPDLKDDDGDLGDRETEGLDRGFGPPEKHSKQTDSETED